MSTTYPKGIDSRILEKTQGVIEEARADAVGRTSKSPEAIERINNALDNRLFPHVLEGEVIASQLETSEYQAFIEETNTFLDVRVEVVACPDGRILAVALSNPLGANFHRKLQGLPEIRPSTSKADKFVLNDPQIAADIRYDIETKLIHKHNAEIVAFMGPHMYSTHPTHGCGAATGKIIACGETPELGMRFGGIKEYFEELGNGFFSFDYIAKVIGGSSSTFDLTHDAYSQGFIIGLRDEYKHLDLDKTLRENLLYFAEQNLIIMTELLDERFKESVVNHAAKMGQDKEIDARDYTSFAKNVMLIGKIAQEVTIQEEKNNFDWIPESISQGRTETATRVLAYHVIRNCVYRILGNIVPGKHSLLKHPEQLIRIGPVGADFNVQNIPFIENIPMGSIRPEDMARVNGLYNLSYGVLKELGIDFTTEGRIILVTGVYDSDRYANQDLARERFHEHSQIALNNSALVRLRYKESIETGETVVIGALYKPDTKQLTHIV